MTGMTKAIWGAAGLVCLTTAITGIVLYDKIERTRRDCIQVSRGGMTEAEFKAKYMDKARKEK